MLDEPLSNLDAKLRAQMRAELSKLHERLNTTFIYVTHDQVEAMTMGTRIVVMKDGFIQQTAAPTDLYDTPTNLFVATFMGSPQMNTFDAKLTEENNVTYLNFGKAKIALPDNKGRKPEVLAYIGKEVVAGVRPESIHDEEVFIAQYPEAIAEAKVDVVEMMGAETYLYLICEGINMTARVSPRSKAKVGDTIKIAFDANKFHLFDKDTEKTITN